LQRWSVCLGLWGTGSWWWSRTQTPTRALWCRRRRRTRSPASTRTSSWAASARAVTGERIIISHTTCIAARLVQQHCRSGATCSVSKKWWMTVQGPILELHSEEFEPVPISQWHSTDNAGGCQLHPLRARHGFKEGRLFLCHWMLAAKLRRD
jgi:hypothetical protein